MVHADNTGDEAGTPKLAGAYATYVPVLNNVPPTFHQQTSAAVAR